MNDSLNISNAPRRPHRKRDESKTTFKNLNHGEGHQKGQSSKFKLHMTDSMDSNMSSSWFIPGDEQNADPSPVPAPRSSRSGSLAQRPPGTTSGTTTNITQTINAQKSRKI